MKKKVLFLVEYFLPGTRSGGPLTTLLNICSAYSDYVDIFIVCKNHDIGQKVKYKEPTKKWIKKDKYSVMYLEDVDYNEPYLYHIFDSFPIIFSCGIYEKHSRMIAKYTKSESFQSQKVYIAPMGQLDTGALHIKFFKKCLFLMYAKLTKFFDKIRWSATSQEEAKRIRRFFRKAKIVKATDEVTYVKPKQIATNHTPGSLRAIFLSRISKKKNLLYAIEILKMIKDTEIYFDVYGFPEDLKYLSKCKISAKKKCPKNIHINFFGAIKKQDVIDKISEYDVFLFPTKSENFGHVIYESLCAGTVPVISDKTPWRLINKKLCISIPLKKRKEFVNEIESLSKLSSEKMLSIKQECTSFAKKYFENQRKTSGYREIFEIN